jgi:hypothetical protein
LGISINNASHYGLPALQGLSARLDSIIDPGACLWRAPSKLAGGVFAGAITNARSKLAGGLSADAVANAFVGMSPDGSKRRYSWC